MKIGQVVSYSKAKGWGFIRELADQAHTSDCFFHVSSVENRTALLVGDVVTYETVPSIKKSGRHDAVDIRLSKREIVISPATEARKVQATSIEQKVGA
jgi:cold shock CspA family protein